MLEARKFSLVQRPWLPTCRPVLRAFTSRAQARVLCTATHDIVQQDDNELVAAFEGPSATRVAPPAAVLKQATELTESNGTSADDTQVVLRSLMARVHQGCRLLLEAGKPEQCLALLDASSFLILDMPMSDEDLSAQLMSQLIPRANTDTAVAALRMVAPGSRAYRAALRAFAAKGSARGVGEVVKAAMRERVLQGPESRELWLAAITAFGKVKQLENVRWAFKIMRRQGAWTVEDTQGANIMLHALHTDPLLTFIRFQQLVTEGLRPDTSTFNVLLKACMRSKDARRAELVLRWMRKARMRGDETTYNTLIKAFSYSGEFEQVLSVRELMRRQRFEPTPRIWGSLLVACGAAGHLETAAVLWSELKERDRQLVAGAGGAAQAVAYEEGGVHSSPSGGSSSSSSIGGDSNPPGGEGSQAAPEAAQLAGAASSPGDEGISGRAAGAGGQAATGGLLTTEVFNALMTACIDGYQGERALTVFEELRSASPRVRPNLRSYNLAIKGCESPPTKTLRPQQLATAMGLLEELRAQGLAPDEYTYGTLIDLCARAKNGPQALALYEEMQQGGVRPNKTIVTSLFKALGASGMVDDCMRIFRKIVWGPARVRPNAATFRALVYALKENGALGEALRVYQGMREVGHPANNQEFSELVSAAAEHALRHRDAALQQQVLALAEVAPCPQELDLHGMSSIEARAAVLCVLSSAQQAFLQAQQAGQAQQGGDGGAASGASNGSGPEDARVASSSSISGWEAHDITIITGCGRNSADGEAVLPGVVLKLVRDELGIAVQCYPPLGTSAADGSPSPSASASASLEQGATAAAASVSAAESAGTASAEGQGGDAARGGNSGRLIITRQALQQWLEGKRSRARCDSSMGSMGSMSSMDSPPAAKLA